MGSLKQSPFFDIFLGLKKTYDAMDQDYCLKILLDVGVGEKMVQGRQVLQPHLSCRAQHDPRRPIVQESERQLITGRVGRGGARIHIWQLFALWMHVVLFQWIYCIASGAQRLIGPRGNTYLA